jgi:hypothetical protein
MAGIGAQQPGLAGRRLGQEIARDIAGRQADGTHRRNADMGQVLADPGAISNTRSTGVVTSVTVVS